MTNETGTKTRLIEVATELFAEQGAHKVSFQQIASRLGITQAALYKHFDNKDDVLFECARTAANSRRAYIKRSLERVTGSPSRLRTSLRAHFEWLQHYPEHATLLQLNSALVSPTEVARALADELQAELVGFFVQEFKDGARAGDWAATRFENKARVLHSLLEGELLKALRNREELSPERRGQLVWMAFERNLDPSVSNRQTNSIEPAGPSERTSTR